MAGIQSAAAEIRRGKRRRRKTTNYSMKIAPTSYIDEVRMLSPSLPKGGLKSELFLFWNKSQLQLTEVGYKVSLRKNFQRQCCSTLIPLSNGT